MNDIFAVIYSRVSSAKQVSEGHGLDSQESRCREFATYKGYRIAEVFRDEGVSGGLIDRPGMKATLGWLRKRRGQQTVVIIDDISRLARDIEAHKKLRAAIGSVGARLESPSIEFGEDSDSLLIENLLASVSQHQRQKNAEQAKNRMRARALAGYWVFPPMAGYKYDRVPGHGKLLVRDEPVATILADVLEGLASGRFASAAEVKRHLEAIPEWPKAPSGEVLLQSLHYILPRAIYAGYIDLPGWPDLGIRLVRGKHEPLISFETLRAVRERLAGTAHAPARKDLNKDFPLRGVIACGACDHPMTAAWSKGRNRHYAYYVCQSKGCERRGKSIRKEVAETDFEELLRDLKPMPELIALAKRMLRDLWNARMNASARGAKAPARDLKATEQKIAGLAELILVAESPSLISAYESSVRKLEEEQTRLTEQSARKTHSEATFEKVSRTALQVLSNALKLWVSGDFRQRRTLLKLAFEGPIPYCRDSGYRTGNLSLPFKLLQSFRGNDFGMVGDPGIEPGMGLPGGFTVRCRTLQRIPLPSSGVLGAAAPGVKTEIASAAQKDPFHFACQSRSFCPS